MITERSQTDEQQELEDMREELREKGFLFDPLVSKLLKSAYACRSPRIRESLVNRLRVILDADDTAARRQPDEFRPYGPPSLLSQGNLHLMDQTDGVPFKIDVDTVATGLLVLGPQGSGKSRFIVHLCNEILEIRPEVAIAIIDPKSGFGHLRQFLHIDLDKISLDLTPPSNVSLSNFIYEFMPILAAACHLIYGLEFLNQAVDITLSQLQHYTERTGGDATLCLRDIYVALCIIKVSHFRQVGYLDAAKTAISIIIGKQRLFCCRRGLSLEWLFSRNVVINARSLTSEMQTKAFLLLMLTWLFQRARYLPETNRIRHVLIVDDATRFVNVAHQYDAGRRTSPLGHILAVLRASGVCVIFASQLPAQIDPAVLSLCRNIVVVGNVNGEEHLRVIKNIMSLTEAQKQAIPRFNNRETLAFISGSSWPHPIHGWTPYVDHTSEHDMPVVDLGQMIEPWHSLMDIPKPAVQTPKESIPKSRQDAASNIRSSNVLKLILDCINYPYDQVRARIKRLGFSVRIYDAAKTEATQNEYLISSSCGRAVYLIPARRSYDELGMPFPYKRATSNLEHSFYISLAAYLLKQQAGLKVQIETPIGSKGATGDFTTTDKAGTMTAYEFTQNTSNLLTNAVKYQGTAYQKIVWLCRDAGTAKAVKTYFNKSTSVPPELLKKFEYIHISRWISQLRRRMRG